MITDEEKKEYEKKANEWHEQLFEHAKSIVADVRTDQGSTPGHSSILTVERSSENWLPTVSELKLLIQLPGFIGRKFRITMPLITDIFWLKVYILNRCFNDEVLVFFPAQLQIRLKLNLISCSLKGFGRMSFGNDCFV